MNSATYLVNGLSTHVLEAGSGRPLVLFHGGEWGGSAELTWEGVIPDLARHYRVIAPDWLGFGHSAKVIDLCHPPGHRIAHMRTLLGTLDALDAAYIGNSMGGALLLAGLTARPQAFPAQALVLAGAGGFVPNNAARQEAGGYDGTFEGMRNFIKLLLHNPEHVQDKEFVRRWHDSSLAEGAFETMLAGNLAKPGETARTPFGRADITPYEDISIPTLALGGANDTMRLNGWMDAFVPRIPGARGILYENCGHLVPIDARDLFLRDTLSFLRDVYPPSH